MILMLRFIETIISRQVGLPGGVGSLRFGCLIGFPPAADLSLQHFYPDRGGCNMS